MTAWHWYKATVTIDADAYAFGKTIVPYFGWLTDAVTAGTVRINGVTVCKVGNQWDNTVDHLGFAGTSQRYICADYDTALKLTSP